MLLYCSFRTASKGTTARVKAVDHHDIQVGRSPVGASADQVQGIQRRSGSPQASEWEDCSGISVDDDGGDVRLSGQRLAGVAARPGEAEYWYLWGSEYSVVVEVAVRRGAADKKRGNRPQDQPLMNRWLLGYGDDKRSRWRAGGVQPARDSFLHLQVHASTAELPRLSERATAQRTYAAAGPAGRV